MADKKKNQKTAPIMEPKAVEEIKEIEADIPQPLTEIENIGDSTPEKPNEAAQEDNNGIDELSKDLGVENKEVAETSDAEKVETKADEPVAKVEEPIIQSTDEKADDKIVPVKPEEKDEKKKEGPSKFKLFLSKYKVPVIIAAVILVVALAVTLTIVITNRFYLQVSSAEDFLKDTSGKTTYVLKKDVTVNGDLTVPHGMNIDLNKYTLTVTGNLIYAADAGDKDIYIGDKKGILFLDNGALIVGAFDVNSPNATLALHSKTTGSGNFVLKTLKVKNVFTATNDANITITASEYVTLSKSLTISGAGNLNITSTTTTIEDNINASGSDIVITSSNLNISGNITALSLTINNAGQGDFTAEISGSINADLMIIDSEILFASGSAFTTVIADNLTTLDISGNITVSLTGGLEAFFRAGSGSPYVYDTITLHIFENTTVNEIVAVGNVLFYRTLSTPSDVTVTREGAAIICYIAKVNNAEQYKIYVNGTEVLTTADNIVNITDHITEPGTHQVSAKAISSNPLFLDSGIKSIEYVYEIKLDTPSIAINDSDGYKIVFTQVPFATKYKYSINNGNYTDFIDTTNAVVEIDITDKVTGAGSYVVKVKAYGANEEAFKPSEIATRSFIRKVALAEITKDGNPIAIVRDGNNIVLDWDAVSNADYYTITLNGVFAVKTRNTSYTWTLGTLADNTVINVVADGYGYYNNSPAAVVNYEYEQLDSPDPGAGPYVINGNVVLSWTAVSNATEYIVYKNGVQVGDALTTTLFTTPHTPGSEGTYTIEARAEYFRAGVSAGVVIPVPALSAPTLSHNISGDNLNVNFTFASVANATSYELYKVGTPDALITTSNSSPISISYIEGASYYVKAKATGYQSADSNTVIVPAP